MSRDLADLSPVFEMGARLLIERCAEQGVKMVPCATERTVYVQAEYWRQGRSTARINQQIQKFKDMRCLFLAEVLDVVGSQPGKNIITYALPGQGWHQWQLALDCYWDKGDGKATWSGHGFDVYARIANEMGFTAGHYWKKQDSPHVQAYPGSPPSKTIEDWQRIDDIMEDKYGSLAEKYS